MSNEVVRKTAQRPYRYPGVQPFTTGQADVFFGREQDVAELWRLIRRESLVVLYGKSGLGKSSLINAGIIPACQSEGVYSPIVIRFGAWSELVAKGGKTGRQTSRPSAHTPLEVTKTLLAEGHAGATFLDRLLPGDASLWHHAKTRQLLGGGRPLLFFDQFEELFTYPESEIRAFKEELAELLNTGIPLRFRRMAEAASDEDLSDEEEDRLDAPMEARIVFAIRSDRMHLLDRLTDFMPTILRHCYELQALRPQDAEEAIVAPAAAKGNFRTPAFTWTPEALAHLLAYLKDPDNEQRVEGILLQLLCQYFEEKKVERAAKTRLDKADLGDLEQIVGNYYAEKIASLGSPEAQLAARRLIEEGLVMEGENIRLSLHEAQIARQYGVGNDLLERLVNSRLLRPEPFMRGGYTYELAHDRLVAPVLRAKAARREEETRLAAEREREAKEQELATERRKRRRSQQFATAMTLLALLAIVAGGYAYAQQQNAMEAQAVAEHERQHEQESRQIADSLRVKSDLALKKALYSDSIAQVQKDIAQYQKDLALQKEAEATRNLQKMRIAAAAEARAKKEKQVLEIKEMLRDAHTFEKAGEYPNAIHMLRAVLKEDPENSEAQRRLASLEKKQ